MTIDLYKGEAQGFELSHERIILAIRRMAGQVLTEVDQANQLLQRRVNEWLGNDPVTESGTFGEEQSFCPIHF